MIWVVSIEWNIAPSEATGDPGVVGVFLEEGQAIAAQAGEQSKWHDNGRNVHGYLGPDGVPTFEEEDWEIDIHVTPFDLTFPAPAMWESFADSKTNEQRRELSDKYGDLSVTLARLAAYFNTRYLGGSHARAVKHQNHAAKELRRVFGFTYPSNDIQF